MTDRANVDKRSKLSELGVPISPLAEEAGSSASQGSRPAIPLPPRGQSSIEHSDPPWDMRLAVAEILQADEFRRSPVLSRLLVYLMEMTALGVALKSHTIATEGLGRPYDESGEADTYARVTVARLRKALSNYCGKNPDMPCVVIDPGTYALKLESRQEQLSIPPVDPVSAQIRQRRWFSRPVVWTLALGLIVILAVSTQLLRWRHSDTPPAWSTTSFPTIAVRATGATSTDARAQAKLDRERKALAAALHDYVGMRVIEDPSMTSDYEVRIHHSGKALGGRDSVTLIEVATGTLVWPGVVSALSGEDEADNAAAIAAAIGSPGGALPSFARRRGYNVNSPYGCWLRFTEGIQTYNTLGDNTLAECSRRWYTAQPDSATAAFLYSWTLTDQSVRELSPLTKASQLQQALDVVHRSLMLNPDVAMLNIAEMRAYSFAGDREGVKRAAQDALAKAHSNRLAAGMAASGLALWNDPEGERRLIALESGDRAEYPWEHVGLFIAAMMHEDVTAAGTQQEALDRYNTGQPLLLILKAAYSARTGQRSTAEAALAKLRSKQIIPVTSMDLIASRLPVAPEVKMRLLEWLRTPANDQRR